MKNIIVILTMLFIVPTLTLGQTSNQKKLQEANSFLEKEDYTNSLKLFRELQKQIDRKDSSFGDVAYGLTASLFYTILDIKSKNNWKNIIDLSNEFIQCLENNKDFLDAAFQEKKYFSYQDIIVAYFGLGEKDKAKPYQQKLYASYKAKQLPKGIDEFYRFEKFVFNDLNVWGYEWYPELGDKEAEGSFSKQVYYIYSRDKDGNDKEQQFTLETVKVHKLKKDEDDLVLTKRIYGKDQEQSETIWTFTFNNPVDYEKLHNAIVEFLKGKVKTDTKTIIKR